MKSGASESVCVLRSAFKDKMTVSVLAFGKRPIDALSLPILGSFDGISEKGESVAIESWLSCEWVAVPVPSHVMRRTHSSGLMWSAASFNGALIESGRVIHISMLAPAVVVQGAHSSGSDVDGPVAVGHGAHYTLKKFVQPYRPH